MTEEFNPASLLNSITLPSQNLSKLSFCNSNKPSKVIEWASELKTTQILNTSVQFYKALPEICKLKTSYKARLQMLEEVRPQVQHSITGLTKEFLNQPVLLPPDAQKAAIIAQAIQKQLLDGYLITLKSCLGKGKIKDSNLEDATLLIHRAMNSVGLIFFRGLQLYTSPPQSLWDTAHRLYQIAFFYSVNTKVVNDCALTVKKASNIDQTYIRLLLMAACRSNQLNQLDIASTYKSLETWSELVTLNDSPASDSKNKLIVNVERPAGPTFKGRNETGHSGTIIEIETKRLLDVLAKNQNENIKEEKQLNQESGLSVSNYLISHLCSAWDCDAKRHHERRPINNSVDLCVGLSDCHRVLAQGEDFQHFLQNSARALPLDNTSYNASFTPRDQFDSKPPGKVSTYQGSLINISRSGYCILWKDKIPTKLQAGEILLVKENRKPQWSLAVIRWIKQLKTASQIGVEIIASQPEPSAIAQTYEMGGEADFGRALFVKTELSGKLVNTVITASAPFVEGSKAKLLNNDKSHTIKLDKCIFSTSTVLQFTYHRLAMSNTEPKKTTSKKSQDTSSNAFDDSWDET